MWGSYFWFSDDLVWVNIWLCCTLCDPWVCPHRDLYGFLFLHLDSVQYLFFSPALRWLHAMIAGSWQMSKTCCNCHTVQENCKVNELDQAQVCSHKINISHHKLPVMPELNQAVAAIPLSVWKGAFTCSCIQRFICTRKCNYFLLKHTQSASVGARCKKLLITRA